MREDIFKEVEEEWGDYLEHESRINKEKFEVEAYNIDNLSECYKEWKEYRRNKGLLYSYQTATRLLKNYEIHSLNEKEINEFARDINSDTYYHKGLFFSAVINELYMNEELHLNSNILNQFGCYNEDKKIVVEGDCGDWIGENMKGGEIIVKGDCGGWTGYHMKGGKIIVEGDCEDWIGRDLGGGIIKICGDKFNPKEQISYFAQKGEIYHKDELVWKDGKLI
ncbi:MAG: hypothetical protein KAU95_03200 [Candidatus Aenigmarchaeota archaeon]|nr:hypothetical protein [Candidatus Aenigmarchaeota archaeon]